MIRSTCAALAAALSLASSLHAYDITGKVVDSAGAAIANAKVWATDDTTYSVTTGSDGAFHFVHAASALRPQGPVRGEGLQAVVGPDGILLVRSPKAAEVRLTLAAMDGRALRRDTPVKLSAGANRLDPILRPLPHGAYVLSLRGEGLYLRMRLSQGTVSMPTDRAERTAARVAAKKSAALPDLNAKPGLAAAKDGFAPMLYVPMSDSESGVSVTLKKPIAKPGHIIVIYLENWSFNSLYGKFPGAANLDSGYSAEPQKDTNGAAYAYLPRPWNTNNNTPDSLYTDTMPNAPFSFFKYQKLDDQIPDLVHRFYQEPMQIHGGKMDYYAQVSNAHGMVMGYFDTDSLPLAKYAKDYTLCDHFFHSAFGGSFLNHMWFIAARTPLWSDIPAKYRATLDANGNIVKKSDRTFADGQATPEGYLVNTIYTHNTPHPATAAADQLVPDLDFPTIGDRMNDKGVTWKWYSGGWDSAVAGRPDSNFQFHHQSFAFFKNYADGAPGRAAHLKDEKDFMADLNAGNLPAVSFIKPVGDNNEHPGYTDVKKGEQHTVALIEAIKASPVWNDAVIVITYDENGGFWDHVAPPVIDRWGPGTRVPGIVVSPFAKKGYIDKHTYETVSILSLIERRFSLLPLSSRDAAAADLTGTMDLPN